MLTTRCPQCQTTFRITSAALHKAAGQVRCGQCTSVFSAFDSLSDTLTRIPVDESLQSTMTELPESPQAPPEPHAADESAETAAASTAIPPQQVFEVLEEEPPQIPWHPAEREPAPEAQGWRVAAAIAALALTLQAVHYFRGRIAEAPVAGDAIQRVYSFAGTPILENVDPENFTIVDWVATAQSQDDTEVDGEGSLEISAGVRNTSGSALPYPLLSLELTDRWEKTIGARVFSPAEYLGKRLSENARIGPNTIVTAQLRLVDPGPDAYGFEVDICVAVDAELMRCKNDAVFQ